MYPTVSNMFNFNPEKSAVSNNMKLDVQSLGSSPGIGNYNSMGLYEVTTVTTLPHYRFDS